MVNLLDLYEVQGALCPFWNYFLLSFFQVNETMRAQDSSWNIFRKLHLGPNKIEGTLKFLISVLHFSQQAQARLAGENVTRLLGTSEY